MVKTLYASLDRKSLVESGDRRGEFIGMASVFNVVDLHNDMVLPGAFAKTIRESNGKTKVLLQHNPSRPIGIGEVSESATGLVIKGRLSLATRDGQEAYALMLDGVLDGLSIGYDTVRADKPAKGIRKIHEVKLFEVSVVTFPANTLAIIGAVKAGASVAQQLRALLRDARQVARDAADRALARDLGKVSGGLRRLAERVRS